MIDTPNEQLDLPAVRKRLDGAKGKHYWKSLEELSDTREFRDFLYREFPRQAQFLDAMSRRRFLKLMGASLALAGVGPACTSPLIQKQEKIVPYVQMPENLVLGQPLYFATAMTLGGVATGLLVESNEGRPTKVEGNPSHPGSLGRTDSFAQGSLLTMYDPDRSQVITRLGALSTYDNFRIELAEALATERGSRGAGVRILTENVSSPTLARQFEEVRAQFPAAKFYQYEPFGNSNAHAGATLAYGQPLDAIYDFTKGDVILSLDSDFLGCAAENIRYAHDWAEKRRVESPESEPNRLYAAESTATNTGSVADHRFSMRAGQVENFARTVAARLGVQGVQEGPNPARPEDVAALVEDLQAHRGTSVVIAGRDQPAAIHALAYAMNETLGNVGQTVNFIPPTQVNPTDHLAALGELVRDMQAKRVRVLAIVGGNPAFTAPADYRFAEALKNVPLSLHLSLYDDETSNATTWHLPEAHYLESWSDGRAFDGTESIVQPLIEPLYSGRTAHEIVGLFTAQPDRTSHDIVKAYWTDRLKDEEDPEAAWRAALHNGLLEGSAARPTRPELRGDLVTRLGGPKPAPAEGDLEIIFRLDPTIYDGRFANNGWLQELPKPLTKLTWDNVALMSPQTAERLGVTDEDVVELTYGGAKVNAPVWRLPGHAADSVTVYVGYGRTRGGRVAAGTGFDAYRLRTSRAPYFGSGLQLRKTGGRYPLASTQDHFGLEGRDHVRAATLEEFRENEDFAHEGEHGGGVSLYPEYLYEGNKWGMAIDLTVCTGCNSCVIACQAENNIPVVGKDQVLNGREMHWLRIDTYRAGDVENPTEIYHEPMLCQHCEKAPCEPVCPVAATVHSSEGLNDMIYNRCIGTRYCSNNCPYKVRRFNFLQYNDKRTESLKMMRNPQVTVRERGVMEKCTFCVQRIARARISASAENRSLEADEVVTACQGACPTNAIVFGDINNKESAVYKLKQQPRNYAVLGELNTQPRTTYLAAIRNPNSRITTELGIGEEG